MIDEAKPKQLVCASDMFGHILEDPYMLPGCFAILAGDTIEYHGPGGQIIQATAEQLERWAKALEEAEDARS